MHFDYTYITLFGFIFFEPVVILTNLIFFIQSLIYFSRLKQYNSSYPVQMGWFMLLLGISTVFGAAGHAIHYQLGIPFFKVILFFMNATSLFSIYFCFRAPFIYYNSGKQTPKIYLNLVILWLLIVLAFSAIIEDFTIIKVHAGIVLIYALFVHIRMYKLHRHRGSKVVATGIIISFLPIIVHSLKLSFGEWFNHKDIAHTIMIISLAVIYRGVRLNAEDMKSGTIAA